jgi:DNA processing protein
VAIVGTRRPSSYGVAVAERLADGLARAGWCVVSGLAAGIDSAAHRGALAAGFSTVAVLGHGLDHVFPPSNRRLAAEVAERGTLLTEYPAAVPPAKFHFPERNRIIAALGAATVMVEGRPNSGAIITLEDAVALGRPALAVPGSVFMPEAQGCHQMLRAGREVVLATSVDDVLGALGELWVRGSGEGMVEGEEERVPLSSAAGSLLQALVLRPARIDDLCARLGQSASALVRAATALEVAGLAQCSRGRWQLTGLGLAMAGRRPGHHLEASARRSRRA